MGQMHAGKIAATRSAAKSNVTGLSDKWINGGPLSGASSTLNVADFIQNFVSGNCFHLATADFIAAAQSLSCPNLVEVFVLH
jgi:hypothetical protein